MRHCVRRREKSFSSFIFRFRGNCGKVSPGGFRIGHQREGVFDSSNRRQFNEPFQRNPLQSIAIHCNPHRNPHRNPSQSIAIHRNPSQSIAIQESIFCVPSQNISIAIHRNASVRDTTSYSYLSVSGRKKFQHLISEGHRGGVLAVRGRRQLPSSRGLQKGAPEAGRGRLNYLLTSSKGTL